MLSRFSTLTVKPFLSQKTFSLLVCECLIEVSSQKKLAATRTGPAIASQSLGNLDRRYRVGYGSTNLTKKMKQVLPIKSNSKYWVDVLKEIHFFTYSAPGPKD